jgi:hypothetical protein
LIPAVKPEDIEVPPPVFNIDVVLYINLNLALHFSTKGHNKHWEFYEERFLDWLDFSSMNMDSFRSRGVCSDSVRKFYAEAGWLVQDSIHEDACLRFSKKQNKGKKL